MPPLEVRLIHGEFLNNVKKLSIKTAFPKVKEKTLEVYWVKDISQLAKGYKSILEPFNAKKAELDEIEVIAVPGLAFDKKMF